MPSKAKKNRRHLHPRHRHRPCDLRRTTLRMDQPQQRTQKAPPARAKPPPHPSPTLNRNPKSTNTNTKADQTGRQRHPLHHQTPKPRQNPHLRHRLRHHHQGPPRRQRRLPTPTLPRQTRRRPRHQNRPQHRPRTPALDDARKGDELFFKGDFESNDLGGAVHWTHRDPGNRHTHGYLELNGQRYE